MRWWVALVLVAGCSAIYGLDDVNNDDQDGDHIPKGSDNCPSVYNPDQSDLDGNGSGDACEVCGATDPTDSDGDGIPDQCDGCDNRLPDGNANGVPDACEHPHDEDGDGVPDVHDNCPSMKNPDQLDTKDGGAGGGLIVDGVGDKCDDSTGLDHQMFDSFADPSQLWVVTGQGWAVQDDQASVPLTSTGVYRYVGNVRGTFRVSTHVRLPASGAASVVIVDGPDALVSCSIDVDSHLISVAMSSATGGGQGSVDPYPGNGSDDDLRLDAVPSMTQAGATTYTCVSGTGASAMMTAATYPSWTPGIGGVSSNPGSTNDSVVKFDYFDVITSGL